MRAEMRRALGARKALAGSAGILAVAAMTSILLVAVCHSQGIDMREEAKATEERLKAFGIPQEEACETVWWHDGRLYERLVRKKAPAVMGVEQLYPADMVGGHVEWETKLKPNGGGRIQFSYNFPTLRRVAIVDYHVKAEMPDREGTPGFEKVVGYLFDGECLLLQRVVLPLRPCAPVASRDRIVAVLVGDEHDIRPVVSTYTTYESQRPRVDNPNYHGSVFFINESGLVMERFESQSLSRQNTKSCGFSKASASPKGKYIGFSKACTEFDIKTRRMNLDGSGYMLIETVSGNCTWMPKYIQPVQVVGQPNQLDLSPNWPVDAELAHIDDQGRSIFWHGAAFWVFDKTGTLLHKIGGQEYQGSPYQPEDEALFLQGGDAAIRAIDLKKGLLIFLDRYIHCLHPTEIRR